MEITSVLEELGLTLNSDRLWGGEQRMHSSSGQAMKLIVQCQLCFTEVFVNRVNFDGCTVNFSNIDK